MSHPYYNIVENSNIYALLQQWIYIDKSIEELETIFPIITNMDLVYLSLVYYPIPESKYFFDSYTLFYHSCRIGQENPLQFINAKYPRVDTLAIIAYKFGRLDLLESDKLEEMARKVGYQLFTIKNMLLLKNRQIKLDSWNRKGHRMYFGTGYKFWDSNANVLFTDEELIENFVLDYALGYNRLPKEEGYEIYGDTFKYLINPSGVISFPQFMDRAFRLGKQTVADIILRYLPEYEEQMSKSPEYPSANNNVSETVSVEDLLNNIELVEAYIPEDKRGMYYITSGDFGAYIQWINSNKPLNPIDNKYVGINEFGECSLDRTLVAISKTEFKSLSLEEGKKGISNNYKRE